MEEKKRCFNCRWFAMEDTGYSNYSVQETIVHCLRHLNPAFPMDESYSWENENSTSKDHEIPKFAETCPSYEFSTDQIHLDVDGDDTIEDWKKDKELYELAVEYFKEGD